MLTRNQWRAMGRAKLAEASVLFANGKYDGATYLCGYVIEFYLKGRICKTLKFAGGYPTTRGKFLKTHNLDELLLLSGMDEEVRASHMADWSLVKNWNPEMRYDPVPATLIEAQELINAVRRLMRVL